MKQQDIWERWEGSSDFEDKDQPCSLAVFLRARRGWARGQQSSIRLPCLHSLPDLWCLWGGAGLGGWEDGEARG